MSTTLTRPPDRLAAGVTVAWTVDAPDYPAPTWTLAFEMVSATVRTTAIGTNDGAGKHVVTLSATVSSGLTSGTYPWRQTVSSGTSTALVRYQVDAGHMAIDPNFAAAVDARSFARTMLDSYETALKLRATNSPMVASYQIAGRSLQSFSDSELLTNRDRYLQEVKREEAAERLTSGLRPRNTIYTRM
jgi:hypothetical protein